MRVLNVSNQMPQGEYSFTVMRAAGRGLKVARATLAKICGSRGSAAICESDAKMFRGLTDRSVAWERGCYVAVGVFEGVNR